MKSTEIGNEFTKEGLAKLKVGQVLVYDYEGSRTELKITKINRKSHKLYVQEVKLYTDEEIDALTDEDYERLKKTGDVQ